MASQTSLFSFFGKPAGGKPKPKAAAKTGGKAKAKAKASGKASPGAAAPKVRRAPASSPAPTTNTPPTGSARGVKRARPEPSQPTPSSKGKGKGKGQQAAADDSSRNPPSVPSPAAASSDSGPSPPASSPAAASTTPASPPTGAVPRSAGDDLVGKRVEVFWSGERQWFAGEVKAWASDSGKHRIVYDDGDKGHFSLVHDKVRYAAAAEEEEEEETKVTATPSVASSAGDSPGSRKRPRRAATKRPVVMDSDSDEDEPMIRRKPKAKPKAKKGRKGRKKAGDSDDDYEMSANEASESDLDLAPTSESEAEESLPPTPVKRKPRAPRKPAASKPSGRRLAKSFTVTSLGPSPSVGSTGGDSVLDDKQTVFPAGQHEHDMYDWLKPEYIRDGNGTRRGEPGYDRTTLRVGTLKKTSPANDQWWNFKSQNFDTILFFKVGKFYELYHMDADVGVKECDLVYMKGRRAHCGFPEIAYSDKSEMLVKKGYRVARVEQTQTPQQLKEANARKGRGRGSKVVERELCSIKSKGTVTYSHLDVSEKAPMPEATAYLLSIRETELPASEDAAAPVVRFGVCLVEASTAEVLLGDFDDDRQRVRLRTMLVQYAPVEVVYREGGLTAHTMRLLKNDCRGAVWVPQPSNQAWGAGRVLKELLRKDYFVPEGADRQHAVFADLPDAVKRLSEEDQEDGALYPRDGHSEVLGALGSAVSHLRRCLIEHEILSFKQFDTYTPPDLSKTTDEAPATGAGAGAGAGAGVGAGADAGADAAATGDSGEATVEVPPRRVPHMVLDGNTLLNLEILESNYDGSKKGTLLGALPTASTPMGNRLLRGWMCNPLFAIDDINARLDAVDNLMSMSSTMESARSALKKVPDLERLLSRAHTLASANRAHDHPDARAVMYMNEEYSRRKVKDLISMLKGFTIVSKAAALFADGDISSELLKRCVASPAFERMQQPLAFFKNAFDHADAAKTGIIKPRKGVVEEYDTACEDVAASKDSLASYLTKQRQKLGSSAVKYFHSNKDRYQLEVPEAVLAKHQPDHYELTSRRKGFRRFWTPQIKEMLETLKEAEDRQAMLVKEQMRMIFAKFDKHRASWSAVCSSIMELDALMAVTVWSIAGDGNGPMCRPQFVEPAAGVQPLLHVRSGRHPGIASTFTTGSFIPNDTLLGPDADADDDAAKSTAPCALITGPNMGGKSTILRQTCCCVILAQMGCYVPAESCRLTPVDRIFTRVGASDRILAGQSTFFVELAETSAILRCSTPNSLVILDELGRGTSTFDGNAIAYAVTDHLTRKVGCRTLFATHYHSLTEDFEHNPAVGLYHMACMVEEADDGTSRVTFLYKLQPGDCPKSYGMNVARLAHIPDQVIKRAHQRSAEFEEALLQARAGVEQSQRAAACFADAKKALDGGDQGALVDVWRKAQAALAANTGAEA